MTLIQTVADILDVPLCFAPSPPVRVVRYLHVDKLASAIEDQMTSQLVPQSVARATGRLALLSSLIGLVAVGCLIAALIAPTPSPHSMRRETDFFRWQDAGVILQAMVMVPVIAGLLRLSVGGICSVSRLWAGLGVVAQITLMISSALIFTGAVADMFYMAPLGLVGFWLLAVSGRLLPHTSATLVWTGRVAGFGLLLIGTGFLIYGAFVAPAIFLRPLTNTEIDAQSLTMPNLVAHLCMGVGTLLGRVGYPIWTLLLGRALLRYSDCEVGANKAPRLELRS